MNGRRIRRGAGHNACAPGGHLKFSAQFLASTLNASSFMLPRLFVFPALKYWLAWNMFVCTYQFVYVLVDDHFFEKYVWRSIYGYVYVYANPHTHAHVHRSRSGALVACNTSRSVLVGRMGT
jgi:hypothetical protein